MLRMLINEARAPSTPGKGFVQCTGTVQELGRPSFDVYASDYALEMILSVRTSPLSPSRAPPARCTQ